MTKEQFINTLIEQHNNKVNAEHPYRRTAIAIIEQIIEPQFIPQGLIMTSYEKLANDLVNLLDNYLTQ